MTRRPPVELDVEARFAMTPEALLYDPDAPLLAKVVYAVLIRHGQDPENCFPSHARIAKLLGVSERSINKPLRWLDDHGWIDREYHDGSVNHYLVRFRPRAGVRGVAESDDPNPAQMCADSTDPALRSAPTPRPVARPPRAQERA